MKNNAILKSAAICVLEHAAVCAFIALLTSFMLDSHDLSRIVVLVCLVLLTAAGAFWFGVGIRSGQEDKNTCWNAAMGYYLVNILALVLLWKFNSVGAYGDLRPENALGLIGQIWCIPSLAPLSYAAKAIGAHDFFYLLVGAALAIVEPMSLTFGLLYSKKSTDEEKINA